MRRVTEAAGVLAYYGTCGDDLDAILQLDLLTAAKASSATAPDRHSH